MQEEATNILGPGSYANWRDFEHGLPARMGEETLFYSDAHVVGDVLEGWGPYQVLNTLGVVYQPACVPVLCLRTMWHSAPANPKLDVTKSDTTNYHGGGAEEEIAALIGLALKIRLRPGDKTRDIDVDSHIERPRTENPATIPLLLRDRRRPPMIPNLDTTKHINKDILAAYPGLSPEAATALVRSARLFQNGLWLSESSPNESWLMFVSAVEVAAVYWRDDIGDPETLLRELEPKWAERLDKTGDKTVTADMGKFWKRLLRATARFVDFIMTYMPGEPAERPAICQVEWKDETLREAMKKIYRYRSEALHSGIPFPAPMCLPSAKVRGEDTATMERPMGLATWSQGGVWVRDDLPMFLHIFAHIVHGALVKWWTELKGDRGKADMKAIRTNAAGSTPGG